MWTGRPGKITRQGASASSCELDNDHCRSRTTRSTLDDDLDDNHDINRCQEDPAPYTYDDSSAPAGDYDSCGCHRLRVSICHLRE
jgi:hypothetical protein